MAFKVSGHEKRRRVNVAIATPLPYGSGKLPGGSPSYGSVPLTVAWAPHGYDFPEDTQFITSTDHNRLEQRIFRSQFDVRTLDGKPFDRRLAFDQGNNDVTVLCDGL